MIRSSVQLFETVIKKYLLQLKWNAIKYIYFFFEKYPKRIVIIRLNEKH